MFTVMFSLIMLLVSTNAYTWYKYSNETVNAKYWRGCVQLLRMSRPYRDDEEDGEDDE